MVAQTISVILQQNWFSSFAWSEILVFSELESPQDLCGLVVGSLFDEGKVDHSGIP